MSFCQILGCFNTKIVLQIAGLFWPGMQVNRISHPLSKQSESTKGTSSEMTQHSAQVIVHFK